MVHVPRDEPLNFKSKWITTVGEVGPLFASFGAGSPELGTMPFKLRKHLLAVATEHHDKLVELSDDDPLNQIELARSLLRIAELHFSVGVDQAAVAACEHAERLMQASLRTHGERTDTRMMLAQVQNQLGFYQLARNQIQQSRESLELAIANWQLLLAADPDDPDCLNGLARSYNSLGFLLSPEKSERALLAVSLDYHQRSVDIRRKLLARQPDDPLIQRSLALAIRHLSGRVAQNRQLEKAIELQLESNALFEILYESNPDSADYRLQRAIGFNQLGDKFRDQQGVPNHLELALHEYDRALREQEALVREHPGIVIHSRNLTNTLDNIGTVHFRRADYLQALARFEQALQLFDEMNDLEPQSVDRAAWASAQLRMARVLAELGRTDDAMTRYQESIDLLSALHEAGDERPQSRESLFRYLLEASSYFANGGKGDRALTMTQKAHGLADGDATMLFQVARTIAQVADAMDQDSKRSIANQPSMNRDEKTTNTAHWPNVSDAADQAMAALLDAHAAGWRDFGQLWRQAEDGRLAFDSVWRHGRYQTLPADLAFAFDVRARQSISSGRFFRASRDWTRWVSQGLFAEQTYDALRRQYIPLSNWVSPN